MKTKQKLKHGSLRNYLFFFCIFYRNRMRNQYEQVKADRVHANNNIEDWNSGIQAIIPSPHPPLWRLTEALAQQLRMHWMKRKQYLAGAVQHHKCAHALVKHRLETGYCTPTTVPHAIATYRAIAHSAHFN
jgi:hypothetical protein